METDGGREWEEQDLCAGEKQTLRMKLLHVGKHGHPSERRSVSYSFRPGGSNKVRYPPNFKSKSRHTVGLIGTMFAGLSTFPGNRAVRQGT